MTGLFKFSRLKKIFSGAFVSLILMILFQNCSSNFEIQNADSEKNASSLGTILPACSPTQSQACSENHGHGIQYCALDGTPSLCQIESCDSDYMLNNGQCVSKSCTPKTITSCTGKNGTGKKECSSTGEGFGNCNLTACDNGYNLQNGECVSNACAPETKIACSNTAGDGVKTCNAQGTSYGECRLSSCKTGFNLQNGSCVANACSPGQSVSCSGNLGSGTKTCNSSGTGYGACQLTNCNAGYVLQNGSCVAGKTEVKSVSTLSQSTPNTAASTCNLYSDGSVSCSGWNVLGGAGVGLCSLNVPITTVFQSDIVDIVTGIDFMCALTSSGSVYCWGRNANGEVGNGLSRSVCPSYLHNEPSPQLAIPSGATKISAGDNHMCAITTGGGLKCWGYNLYGQVNGNTTSAVSIEKTPTVVYTSGVTSVYASKNDTCATINNQYKCWGMNYR